MKPFITASVKELTLGARLARPFGDNDTVVPGKCHAEIAEFFLKDGKAANSPVK
jgi:shikimate kinase